MGGINADREWRRLYPVMLRSLPIEQRFRTWDIIEVPVSPSPRDHRAESHRPHLAASSIVGRVKDWASRCEWVEPTCFSSLSEMIDQGRSLGPVAVSEVLEILAVPDGDTWDPKRQAKLDQLLLFDDVEPLEKIPFRFRFLWRDGGGNEHDSLVLSWEMAQTWRTYRKRYADPIEKIKEKLLGDYFSSRRAVSFFMGNMARFRDTFMVCGWFIPPKSECPNEYLF